jgi:outer membrane protein OmpA-like peptidoglycan-associated protein
MVKALALSSLVLTACIPRPPVNPGDLDMVSAVRSLAADLSHQLGPAPFESRTLVIDPLLDGRTGQQNHACQQVEQGLATELPAAIRSAKVLTFDSAGAAQSRLLVTGTLTALPAPDHYKLSVALSDRQSGLVLAQEVVPFRQPNMDVSPTRFYNDSPSLVRDRSVEGYLRTAETPAGKPADALYMDQVPTAALLADALTAYNAERPEQALALYSEAVKRRDGQQLRTFNGIYLTNIRLGRMKDAEEAFAKIAALGLATNNLAVKLLFRPGGTDFWPDPNVSAVYPMWLRQIARATHSTASCLNIVGHTSHSGSEQANDRLSLARATVIRDRLEREAPGLARKSKVSGVGYRENLVGSGADDASDAIDRRVEFKVVGCEP